MTRKPSAWNLFVKKVYQEGKAKNKNYEFKDALVDASKRKSEMGSNKSTPSSGYKKSKKSKRGGRKSSSASRNMSRSASASMAMAGGRTRKRRRH